MRIVVLAKQVPDTKNVTGEVMKPDGTLNRAALAAVFNPEDLNALEMALDLKDRYGGEVIVITMGPPRAADILRDALCRGADRVILLSDRRFAGADTLATSYTIAQAITTHLMPFDLIACGRQAIDGDTAQVPPQVAEKLGIPQVTYVVEAIEMSNGRMRLRRDLGRREEIVEAELPLLITVPRTANRPRWPNARRLLKYRHARCGFELEAEARRRRAEVHQVLADLKARGLYIETWGAEEIQADLSRIGLGGSPTKVKKVDSVVLKGRSLRFFPPDDKGIKELVGELIEERTFG
ncbi:MAG: electron transfer flavoprotein subunit beta/FixA family protein [Bryobacterales bacterium]|nr:electron transfer flavoprotein subunit beta/FixA family protein [Bryobacteraceae bacterium]MDW8129721.1 electron transfer flavoprotein subunit beta/FixA family protein [Bryobacterales bacterium]